MRTLDLVLGGVIAAVAASCGGSGSASTVTVTGQPASSAASTADTAPTPKQEFAAFLDRLQPLRKQSNDQLHKCYKLEQSVNSYDSTYSGWAAAARCSRREAKLDKRVADKLAAIVPPNQLRRPYLAYVRSYRSDGQVASSLSATLTKRQFFNWNTYYGSAFKARNQVVANFRVAVIAYAAQHGFGVPGWVHHIGGK
jgi:hypothetical protein